jgi:Polyketide cyclase / dehydrase and lipid transport
LVERPALTPVAFPRSLSLALLLAGWLSTASWAAQPPGAAQGDDTDVAFVQTTATIRVHARREAVWALLTSCATALDLVQGLKECEVLDTAPDGSWQLIRQVIDYSWYVPTLTYVLRDTYDYPRRISIQRESGDLRTLKASWSLEAEGEFTVLRYSLEVAPGFWVPRWLVRIALKHDLPKMLRNLRTRAEASAGPPR